VHSTLQLMNASQSAIEACIGVVRTRLHIRRGDSGGHGVSDCRLDVSERPGMKMDVSTKRLCVVLKSGGCPGLSVLIMIRVPFVMQV